MTSVLLVLLSVSAVGALIILPSIFKYGIKQIFNIVLSLRFSAKNASGKRIRGPMLEWINGQTLEKFLNGRAKSQEWRQYGHVYRLWAGLNPEIVITTSADIRAFHTDSHLHNKARSSNAGWMFHQILGECMGLINGTEWRTIRDGVISSFTHSAIQMKKEHISTESRGFVQNLVASQPKRFIAQAAASVERFPFFCTGTHVYGWLTEDEKSTLWQLGQRSLHMMGHVLSGGVFRFSFAKWWYPQAVEDLNNFARDWFAFNEKVYNSRRERNLMLPIVCMWKQMENGDITREHLLHTLSEILFANLDVSKGTLSWLVIYLASDKNVQQGILDEMKQNKDSIDEYCARKDTLLAYSLLETMRLRPFTVFSIPESSPSAKILGGYSIPPNTSIIVDTLAVNYNEKFWGSKAETFSPLRFKSIKTSDLRYNLFTFGFGTRKCLGSHLAELMMKTLVVELLNSYTLELPDVDDKPPTTSLDTWVPISDKSIVFVKKQNTVF